MKQLITFNQVLKLNQPGLKRKAKRIQLKQPFHSQGTRTKLKVKEQLTKLSVNKQ
jgi:hypothetical protein